MADLTPLFSQCVRIVAQELQAEASPPPRRAAPPFLVLDLFASECAGLYGNVTQMTAFVAGVRPLYLQVADGFAALDNGQRRGLSDAEKQALDGDFQLQAQRVYGRLKHLQEYERRRVQVCEHSRRRRGLVLAVFAADAGGPADVYLHTLAAHRMHMLRFLGDAVAAATGAFERMRRLRRERERLLNLLHIQNLDAGDDTAAFMDETRGSAQDPAAPGGAAAGVPPEQLQELVQENRRLLSAKASQFQQVERLQHLMVDIVKLQAELSSHLETQAAQIGSLLDNQAQIGLDLRSGNRSLGRASGRNKRGSDVIVATCLVLGSLLLFVDYVS
ncbi:hypothetical protein METBIDRAFT_11262 [Metschnikowia bicuspidata var. bicuspidata NRRL YB-4993]|uniref:t-SNARE coiled-coil homology domain-containing protein n=1 Tax=Metschnikowia bicuspidata var. bicuspidata NRRL YB-4993 TaxID=869754 RepID=A0A1A0HEK4_9ASCO|nr:hypothetical protein METBIDRAFT_11262 [Metschnikowia bicuspidata var. bicuspidata NRRL YB-4993]OBA22426.1 hypothetical protein METBIDRAFT_11262 [Metschnikowia bicuspidata var. bicuspidata NRRL YB-4993]